MDGFLTHEEELQLEQQFSKLTYPASQDSLPAISLPQSFSNLWVTRQPPPAGSSRYIARDPIHRAINNELRQLRACSLEVYKMDLFAWPASDARADFVNGSSNIKFFHFQEGWDMVHTIPVMLVQGLDEDESEVYVKVRLDGRWVSLDRFISYLVDRSSMPIPPQHVASEQWNWWCNNGNTFNLLGLPAEIRERIYFYAVRPKKSIFENEWRVKPEEYGRYVRRGEWHQSTAPDVNLLKVNKQVSREAAYVLYTKSQFEFTKLRQLENFFSRPGGNWENIRNIQLDLSHKDYLKLFGAQLSPGKCYDVSFAAINLMNLKLQKLDIVLPHPSDLQDSQWLWDEVEDEGCQTQVVDWILHFAKPYIKNQPFELHGYIKNSQKKAFMKSIANEKTAPVAGKIFECDEEEGGVMLPLEDLDSGYDTGSEINSYFSLKPSSSSSSLSHLGINTLAASHVTDSLPAVCKCKMKCSLYQFYDDEA